MISYGSIILNCHNTNNPLISILVFGTMVPQGSGMKNIPSKLWKGEVIGGYNGLKEDTCFLLLVDTLYMIRGWYVDL